MSTPATCTTGREAAPIARTVTPASSSATGTRQARGTRGAASRAETPPPSRPKAVIAPHAGYIFSGPIAGSAYGAVSDGLEGIERVVLLGPSHFVPFVGLALPRAEAFQTPLGL